ncbi:hypothetical protein Pmani_031154 [Petrolisthes manimaculis]|uniref:LRRCT domain-containing protein n=1 Tax=Petrolisthes manimaculis TaxID=1843537 RepID=A0AAE1NVW0_9EUCA|nr:hypothetical protein Pmani_031154 [Petrolisthes manimaculis]
MEQLFLQRNQIASIAACALCDLTSLKGLDLQANQLANLSGPVFSRLASLETLDLSQNPLLALDSSVFTGLTAVRVLQVSRVHSLTLHLPDTLLDPLKGLQILEMYGSPRVVERICNTTRMLHSLRSLRELNIMHNDIIALRPDFPVFFPKLQVAKLSGNAWDCSLSERVLWMKRWMTRSPVHFYKSHSIRCATPHSLGYKPVMLLEESDFTTTPPPLTTTTTTTTSLGGQQGRDEGRRDTLHDNTVVERMVEVASLHHHHQYIPRPTTTTTIKNTITSTTVSSSSTIPSITTTSRTTIPTTTTSTTGIISRNTGLSVEFQPYWLVHNRMPPPAPHPHHHHLTQPTPTTHTTTYTTQPTQKEEESLATTTRICTKAKKGDEGVVKRGHGHTRERGGVGLGVGTAAGYKDLWVYRGDSHHTIRSNQPLPVGLGHGRVSDGAVVGAGVVATCVGVALLVGGFLLARGRGKGGQSWDGWTSYWYDSSGDDVVLTLGLSSLPTHHTDGGRGGGGGGGGGGDEVDDGEEEEEDDEEGVVTESEGTVGVLTDTHHGLNNRLYLLLQSPPHPPSPTVPLTPPPPPPPPPPCPSHPLPSLCT